MRKIMKLSFIPTLLAIIVLSVPVWAGPMGPHVERVAKTGKGNFAGGQFARTFTRIVEGQPQTFAHIFICADKKSISALRALGVEINTITSSGIMTAIAPVTKLKAIAAVAGVRKIEAGHALKLFMDESAGLDGVNLPDTSFPRPANTGAGVVIGVIDSGIDIEHPDFMDANGNTRIIAIWDHTLDPADVGDAASNPVGFTYGTEWPRSLIQQGYTGCRHRDNDGHGTHVAGTAAGDGSAQESPTYDGPYVGLAPEAELLIVKFDIENEKDRNVDTYLLDGINWIFQKASGEGKPCVINMSLGTDYGPHDGSTAGERGIDDLTGPNKIACTSAGNAATPYSNDLDKFGLWGAPIHGSGNFNTDSDVVLTTAADYQPDDADDYILFDIWYPGSDTCRVQITTPGNTKYPPHFNARYRNLWKTGGISGAFDTAEGCIYVQNISGASTIWETDNGDNNIYIEISDYYGTNPAPGTWVVEIIPLKGSGAYHSWHGFSDSLTKTYFWYDSGTTGHAWGDLADPFLSDSVMTIGKPGTASQVISVGAYQTKNVWPARQYVDWTDPTSDFYLVWQEYGVSPIDYYFPFHMHDLAFFSSRGPSRDGRVQPFISAPGVGIVAPLSQTVLADPFENYHRKLNRVEYDGYHTTLQGTSMSSPHVTGSIALLLEEAMDNGLSPGPDEIKGYLAQGARVDGFTGVVPNNDWGHGKIDVTLALAQVEPPPLTITTESLPDGTEGVYYSATLEATGGTQPYTWAIVSGSLPEGLSLDPGTGEVSGTPLSQGESVFTAQVTDASAATATQNLSITINPAGALPPEVTGCEPATGSQNERLSVTISGANFQAGATVSFGAGIAVQTTSVISSIEIDCRIKINKKAKTGSRDVIVTNPDGQSGTLAGGFTVQ
jgi:subtilisin family serine protease